MARPSTGSVFKEGGRWKARLTLPDGTRRVVPLPRWYDERKARAKAQEMALAVQANGADLIEKAAPARGETVEQYSARWLAAREARGLTSVGDDQSRLRTHVFEALGKLEVRAVVRRDIERLVEALDAKIMRCEISWKTATNVWLVVSKLFADACGSKQLALRVRDDSPAAGVRGPDRGVRKAKVYLYPSECTALLACDEVPLRWRRVFAVAVYSYLRANEVRALRWEDVDLDHGVIHVHRSIDSARGVDKATKAKKAGRIAIEPALLPLLRLMHAEANGVGRVLCWMPSDPKLALGLRKALRQAGVTRADLFANDATRKNITFHDLRATAATWAAVRGDEPIKLMHRLSHESITTTMMYVREAENVGESFGEVFPRLPASLIESIGPGVSAGILPGRDALADDLESNSRTYSERETGLEPATLSLGS